MNMKSGLASIVVVGVLVALVGNVVAFAAPFEHTPTFWVSYVFIWVAFVVAIAANCYVAAGFRSATSSLYRASISSISILYLVVAAACSLGFMAVKAPTWIVLIVQVALMAACLISLIGGDAGARLVEYDEAVTREQIFYITTLHSQVEALKSSVADGVVRESLARLSEDLKYSDPVSSAATMTLENDLANYMNQLYAAVQMGDAERTASLCGQMQSTLAQRNILCRTSK